MHYFSFIVATLLIIANMVGLFFYCKNTYKKKYREAEKNIMISGYLLIGTMVLMFILLAVGYDAERTNVELDLSYNSLWFTFIALPICAILIFADLKTQKWVKSLTVDHKKGKASHTEGMKAMIFVIAALVIVNIALYCVHCESFFYIILD